jgi:hypothetical protein
MFKKLFILYLACMGLVATFIYASEKNQDDKEVAVAPPAEAEKAEQSSPLQRSQSVSAVASEPSSAADAKTKPTVAKPIEAEPLPEREEPSIPSEPPIAPDEYDKGKNSDEDENPEGNKDRDRNEDKRDKNQSRRDWELILNSPF